MDGALHSFASIDSITTIRDVSREEWNALAPGDPFMRHEFLAALEASGCVGAGTAWEPCHLLARDGAGALLGALPLYFKHDSLGEFVFDWSWADAYERAGLAYYPKLVSAVPFTPATGPRILACDPGRTADLAIPLLTRAADLAREHDASSLHVLFPAPAQSGFFRQRGFLERKGCQFHWRNESYASFEQFLERFSSAKRKKVRRERRRIAEAGITFEHLRGDEPSPADWEAIYRFYARTFRRRGRQPYLNRAFFAAVAATMPESLLVVLARHAGEPIGTAICFRGTDTLYGRYWGSGADLHSLHFETCYYQGIDYCIANGLSRFEPGTQGEHKISRGFDPTPTWSYHWIANAAFAAAINDFLDVELAHVDTYMEHLSDHVPYRRAQAGDGEA